MIQSPTDSSHARHQNSADGTLLGLLTAAFYGLFTLLPGSSTLMVAWPWVFLWQVALALPILWLLWQVWHKPLPQLALGNGLDWVALLALVGLGISTLGAEFPAQARWYSWAAVGGLAALYALKGWLQDTARMQRLLEWQGYLALALIGLSLGLWVTQIYGPERARLQSLQQYGVEARFSFQFTSLRNWQPMGHQNYVAGYLVLVLPLFVGLALGAKGWRRWVWMVATGLGLINLYTTSSRGGWLALLVTGLVGLGVALVYSPLPRRLVLALGSGATGLLILTMLSNSRLRQGLAKLTSGHLAGGELSYRAVTNAVGWRMGQSHPLTGVGPGSVPLVYQHYRPHWAGRDAELQFQLHSTPAQLWGELGLGGMLVPLALGAVLIVLVWRWQRQGAHQTPAGLSPGLVWCLVAALIGFSLLSLTDYQLDIVAIGGVLWVYLATLAATFHPQGPLAGSPLPSAAPATTAATDLPFPRLNRLLAALGLGLTLAMGLWLIPIHRAWALSNQGFAALAKQDVNGFVQALSQAHSLAPWEPYYPYQLGWNLGDLSYQVRDNPELRATLLKDAIAWFEVGNAIVPYQEFGHSNLGWLQLENQQPELARASFQNSAALVPAKPGVFFGLGFSSLQMGDRDGAVEALTLEMIRHPALVTSPIWRLDPLASLYAPVTQRLEQRYGEILAAYPQDPELTGFLHQGRGSLRWWQGDWAGAAQDWEIAGGSVQQALLALAQGQPVAAETLPETPAKYALLAWQTPSQRQALLEKAWVIQPEDVPQLAESLPPPERINELVESMAAATDFTDWLQRTAPSWQPRSNRLGFGVLSRHIDGPNPSDFYPRVENVPVVQFLGEAFPSPIFLPALDRALAPYRQRLGQPAA
ncbi:MAG TPA: O-antigen ligase family protein [Leptolyngbyaceae cyanobacterium M65_K2018_010]|nr:O-antigen ligase family protein [Leptolyngbyaceae cyanobacterium M65_K2018_010]